MRRQLAWIAIAAWLLPACGGGTDGDAATPEAAGDTQPSTDAVDAGAQPDGDAKGGDAAGRFDALPDVTPCIPDCGGRTCGTDGCGGTCGSCPNAVDQCIDGQCACAATCPKDLCGTDSCGKTCTCAAGTLCGPDHRCFEPEPQCGPEGYCFIPAGTFVMGDDETHDYHVLERYPGVYPSWIPAHPVTLTRSFVMKKTEVTVGEWLSLMPPGTQNPSVKWAGCGETCPVTHISYFDMLDYANRLSEARGFDPCYVLEGCSRAVAGGAGTECERALFSGPDCTGYRLPSEAEWEYAARAGSTGCTHASDAPVLDANGECISSAELRSIAWFCPDAGDYGGPLCSESRLESCWGPRPVALKAPNPFGLYDMHGNLWERTATISYFFGSDAGLVTDPGYDVEVTIDDATEARGGFFNGEALLICSFFRNQGASTMLQVAEADGFRLVRTVTENPFE